MSDWALRDLAEVAELVMGQSPPGSSIGDLVGGLPFLQGNAEFGPEAPQPRFECAAPSRRALRCDSLISVRAPVGALNRADVEYGIGRGLAAVRFTGVDPRFGHHALEYAAPQLHRVSQGTTFSAIGRSELASLRLAVPLLEEQKRIAAVLGTIDETVRATERVIAKLDLAHEGLRRTLLCVRAGRRVTEVQLGDVIDPSRPIVYGILMPGEHVNGGVPVIKVRDIRDGVIADRRSLLHTSLQIDQQYARSRVREGDVLFSIRGTVGRIAVVPGSLAGANITQDTARLAVKGVNRSYLLAAMADDRFRRFVDVHTVGQAVKGINLRELRKAPLVLLEDAEQEAIGEVLDSSLRRILAERLSLEKLRATRAGLAADLLSGRVRTVAS